MAKRRFAQLRTIKDRTQCNFYLPVDVAKWIKEWSQQEKKSQTRIVVEILEAEKKRRNEMRT